MKRKLKEEGLNADLKQEELFNKLLDNSQNDIECTLQLLDIIQNELSRSEFNKSRLTIALMMLRLHLSNRLNLILKLKYQIQTIK